MFFRWKQGNRSLLLLVERLPTLTRRPYLLITNPCIVTLPRLHDVREICEINLQGMMDKWSNGQGSLEKGSVMTIWTLFCWKAGRIAETVRSFLLTTRLSALARAPAVRSLTHHTLCSIGPNIRYSSSQHEALYLPPRFCETSFIPSCKRLSIYNFSLADPSAQAGAARLS